MIYALLSTAFAESPMTVHTWTLENNDTVILVEDHRVPVALVNTRFTIGGLTPWFNDNHGDEAMDILYFDADQQIAQRANVLAADLSSGCDNMACKTVVTVLKTDLDDGVQLYKDMLGNTNIDTEELDRWQKGQKIDWEGQLQEPDFIGRRAAMAELYPNEADARRQGYFKPDDISSDADVLNATAMSIMQTPGRIIGFAGDLTKDEVEVILKDLLPESKASGELAPPVMSKPKTIADGRPSNHTVTMPNLTQVYFHYYRDAIAYDDPDYPAYLLADHVLGGHFYSRLYQSLRHEEGDTYGVSTVDIMYPSDPGAYLIETFTRTDNKENVKGKLHDILKTYSSDGMTEVELEEAKSHLLGRRKSSTQSPMSVLGDLATNKLFGLPHDFDDAAVEKAAELDLETVNAFIGEFYNPERFTLLTVESEE